MSSACSWPLEFHYSERSSERAGGASTRPLFFDAAPACLPSRPPIIPRRPIVRSCIPARSGSRIAARAERLVPLGQLARSCRPARLPPRDRSHSTEGVEERFGAKRSRCAPIFQRPDLSPARCNYVAPPARSSARPRPTGFARGLHTITTAEFVPAHGGAAHRWRANPTSLPAE